MALVFHPISLSPLSSLSLLSLSFVLVNRVNTFEPTFFSNSISYSHILMRGTMGLRYAMHDAHRPIHTYNCKFILYWVIFRKFILNGFIWSGRIYSVCRCIGYKKLILVSFLSYTLERIFGENGSKSKIGLHEWKGMLLGKWVDGTRPNWRCAKKKMLPPQTSVTTDSVMGLAPTQLYFAWINVFSSFIYLVVRILRECRAVEGPTSDEQ